MQRIAERTLEPVSGQAAVGLHVADGASALDHLVQRSRNVASDNYPDGSVTTILTG